MKKITTILMLLVLTCAGAWAVEVTTYTTAGQKLTLAQVQQLASQGKHIAFASQASDWSYAWLTKPASKGQNTSLSLMTLYTFSPGTAGDRFFMQRYSDGKYRTSSNDNSLCWSENASDALNVYFYQKDGDANSNFVRIKSDESGLAQPWWNMNWGGFGGLENGYAAYWAYGPFWVVTVDCKLNDASIDGYPKTMIVTEEHELTAPEFAGKKLVEGSTESYTITADQSVVFNYEEVSTVDITYQVVDANNNVLFTSPAITMNQGTAITTLPAEYQKTLFYSYNEVSETADAIKTVTFTATLKSNAPFIPSVSFANAVWYNLTLHNTPNHVTYVANGTQNVQLPTTFTDDETTQWAFIGDPYNGFKIMNKDAGDGLVLGSAATTGSANNGLNVYATLQTEGSQVNEIWNPEATTATEAFYTGKNGFFLRNTEGHALNKRNGTSNISYWTTGADNGSTFVATKVLTDEEKYNELIALLESYPFGTSTNQFSLTLESVDQTENALTLLQNLKDAGYSEDNKAELDKIVAGMSLNLPKPGFYRIKGETSQKYLSTGDFVNDGGTNKFPMTDDATGTNTIFCFDGTKLINYGDGMANGMTKSTWAWVYGPDASTVEFGDGETNGGYFIKSTDAYFFDKGLAASCADRGSSLGTQNQYRCWYLEEVTELPITLNVVGDKSYATFYSPVAISEVEGAEVYVVDQTKPNSVVIEKAETQAIPAGKGVMLVSDEQNTSATLTIGEAGDFETGLNGVTASEQITKDTDPYNSNLFLSKKDGKIGFYKIKTTDNVGVTGGFKAYLSNASAEAKEGFELEFGGVTGIENMEHGTLNMENGAVYNLQGQRVNKAQKGVFIQNGKKVVVR